MESPHGPRCRERCFFDEKATADKKVCADRSLVHLVVNDPRFIALDRLAGAGRPAFAEAAGDEYMQHFRRSDAL